MLTVSLHVPVEVLLVAEEDVEEAVPEVGVEYGVDDGVEHRVRVGHELNPELVGAQPLRQLEKKKQNPHIDFLSHQIHIAILKETVSRDLLLKAIIF